MLHALVEYAQQKNLSVEPGFSPKPARWLLMFTPQGEFVGVQMLDGDNPKSKGQLFPRCPDAPASWLQGGGRSHFLLESLQTVVLLSKTEQDRERTLPKHQFFLDLLRQAAESVPELGAIAQALADQETLARIRAALEEKRAKPTDAATFAVTQPGSDLRIFVAEDSWHPWWREKFRQITAGSEKAPARGKRKTASERMQCFLTGETVRPQPTHDKVKGLASVGGQPTGDVVAGFDKDAFTSFGLSQGANAAMSQQAVKTYVTALNDLLRNRSYQLAGVRVVYWYSGSVPDELDPMQDHFAGWGSQESEEEPSGDSELERRQAETRARRALQAIRSGQRPDLADCRFYTLTLSANAGRVVVRDWQEGQFKQLVENVNRWFDDLSIVERNGRSVVNAFKFNAVLAAPVRELKDASAPLAAALWRCAVAGEAIPYQVMAQTLARIKSDIVRDEVPRHARFGLLKAFCLRNERSPDMTAELNELERDPAYLCGRVMAILARIQQAALGDVGAGVVQRYFAAASATPALVLGRLIRTAQIAHLPKIDKGLQIWFDRQLAELCSKLDQRVPRTLSLEEQTVFALGFYHQMAHREDKEKTGEEQTAEQAEQ